MTLSLIFVDRRPSARHGDMSRLSTTKGKVFERKLATAFREAFPGVEVRRSSQADRAVQSDVYITGHPLLERLWLECNDARNPDPLAKLEQAEGDCAVMRLYRLDALPVVIWHKLGSRTTSATMRLWVLDAIRGELHAVRDDVVTMDLDSLLAILKERTDSKCTCTYEVGSGGPACTCGRRAA